MGDFRRKLVEETLEKLDDANSLDAAAPSRSSRRASKRAPCSQLSLAPSDMTNPCLEQGTPARALPHAEFSLDGSHSLPGLCRKPTSLDYSVEEELPSTTQRQRVSMLQVLDAAVLEVRNRQADEVVGFTANVSDQEENDSDDSDANVSCLSTSRKRSEKEASWGKHGGSQPALMVTARKVSATVKAGAAKAVKAARSGGGRGGRSEASDTYCTSELKLNLARSAVGLWLLLVAYLVVSRGMQSSHGGQMPSGVVQVHATGLDHSDANKYVPPRLDAVQLRAPEAAPPVRASSPPPSAPASTAQAALQNWDEDHSNT